MTHRLIRRHQPLALAVALALGAGSAHAASITVTDGGDAGSASTCTLRQAIASSVNDDATGSTCVAGSGADSIDFDASLANATITLASGELQIVGSDVTINGSGQTIDGSGASGDMYIYFSRVNLSNLTLTGGSSTFPGAGIAAINSDVTLTNSTVSGNTSASRGGGIASYYYAPGGLVASRDGAPIVHRNFAGASQGASAPGGVISRLTMVGSTVSGNTGTSRVGGIFVAQGLLDMTDSTVSGNQLNPTANFGAGGIYLAKYAQATISSSTISGNTANGGSSYTNMTGGIYQYGAALSMSNCTVSGNSASGTGFLAGGMSMSYFTGYGLNTLDVSNSTIAGNNVGSGAPYSTGGLLLGGYSNGSGTLQNTIISGNTGGSDANLYAYSGGATAQYSLMGSNQSGSYSGNGNVFNDNPGLGALANNGGPTMTMAPQAGSPVIDVGSNALIPGGVTYDQRGAGFPRIVNTTVDIGSIEYAAAAPIAPFVPVPASSIWSKGLLGLLAGLFGMLAMRRRRGSSSA
ncbi:MAG: choice-of-anchor Q domain-containing protein [Rhodanobacteraceae bacterium]